jgi:hypothetical protein
VVIVAEDAHALTGAVAELVDERGRCRVRERARVGAQRLVGEGGDALRTWPAVGNAVRRVGQQVLDVVGDQRLALAEHGAVGGALPDDLRDARGVAEQLVHQHAQLRLHGLAEVHHEEPAWLEQCGGGAQALFQAGQPDRGRCAVAIRRVVGAGVVGRIDVAEPETRAGGGEGEEGVEVLAVDELAGGG